MPGRTSGRPRVLVIDLYTSTPHHNPYLATSLFSHSPHPLFPCPLFIYQLLNQVETCEAMADAIEKLVSIRKEDFALLSEAEQRRLLAEANSESDPIPNTTALTYPA